MKSSIRLVFLVAILITACTDQETATVYIPPTLVETAVLTTRIPTSTKPASEDNIPPSPYTPSMDCSPGLTFLEDITIPDGSLVSPGESLDKRWLVRNSGTCNWDTHYGLQLIAGPEMGAPLEYALFPARSGTQAEIHILFTAPDEPGSYRSAWQARDHHGILFGDPIFIEITVTNP